MRMNKKNFKQYDTRWAKLGYPKSPYFIKDCGCGEVAVANCIVEMAAHKNETPKTIQPYCKQYAAPNGNGTYFTGIPAMMKHYGMTDVMEHQTMGSLWKEMSKGYRCAILLMGNRKGGDRKTHWTSSAHFVAATAYKSDGNKHYLYIKDSNSASSDRNGWLAYEDSLRGDVSRVWSGNLNIKKSDTSLTDKVLAACKAQAEWMKNYTYGWQKDPTVEKSKKRGTCVTYVACVLQRIGYLKPGECIWHTTKGKVYGTNDKMTATYTNKSLKALKSVLKAGDIVLVGNKSSIEAGGSSHIFIFAGKWDSNGNPYIWDNHSASNIKKGKNGMHTYSGAKKAMAYIRLKG